MEPKFSALIRRRDWSSRRLILAKAPFPKGARGLPLWNTYLEQTLKHAKYDMVDIRQVKEHMQVIGADGATVGTVDRIEGNRITFPSARGASLNEA